MMDLATYPGSIVVAHYLMTQGLVTSPELKRPWPIWCSFIPDTGKIPGDLVALFDTQGIHQSRFTESGEYSKRDGLQVQVRSTDYLKAWQMMKLLEKSLRQIHNTAVTVRETVFTIYSMQVTAPPVPIGTDESGERHILTLNLTSVIKEK